MPNWIVSDCPITYTKRPKGEPRFWRRWSRRGLQRSGPDSGDTEVRIQRDTRFKGKVACLLLYTAQGHETVYACVLILRLLPGSQDEYERLGIGISGGAKPPHDFVAEPSYNPEKEM